MEDEGERRFGLTLIKWSYVVLTSDPRIGQPLYLARSRVGQGRREFPFGPE